MKERVADVRPPLVAHCESAVLRKPRKRIDPSTSDTELDATVPQSPAAMRNAVATGRSRSRARDLADLPCAGRVVESSSYEAFLRSALPRPRRSTVSRGLRARYQERRAGGLRRQGR